MRRNVTLVVALVGLSWAAPSPSVRAEGERDDSKAEATPRRAEVEAPASKAGQPKDAPDPERMDKLLNLWERRSAQLKSLDIKIDRTDKAPGWNQDEHFQGRAILMSPNLAWLDFKKVVVDDKKKETLVPAERIVCTGDEVWQYLSEQKQIFVFPLDKQERQRALQQGPLPFLFNMRAAEARKRYQMTLISESGDSYVIGVLPLLALDKENFSKAFIKLDKKYLLPTRIYLLDANGKDSKDYTLTNIKPNAEVDVRNFKGQVLGPPWTVVRNPDVNGKPRLAEPEPKRSDPRQPALRSGSGRLR